MTFGQDLIDVIDARIAEHDTPLTAAGTVVTRTGNTTAMVTFDGSALATPVKCFGDVNIDEGDRVGLVKLGVDWTITGTFTRRRQITMPDGATTGTQRWVWGADVPAELASYGMQVALLAYITDSVTGLEVGYFFIGTSNVSDSPPTFRVQAFGNVTYPVAGQPDSATAANVKCNFQQHMWAQTAYTIFKDHDVKLFPGVDLIIDDGGVTFGARSGPRAWLGGDAQTSDSSAVSAEAVVLTTASLTFKAGRAYRFVYGARWLASTANTLVVRIRRTNVTGINVLTFSHEGPTADQWRGAENVARNSTGSDITTVIVLTAAATAGTIVMKAASDIPRYLDIYDCGAAADFANRPSV
jgi:hypothetical protein